MIPALKHYSLLTTHYSLQFHVRSILRIGRTVSRTFARSGAGVRPNLRLPVGALHVTVIFFCSRMISSFAVSPRS